jgi:ABC-type sugar transport system permease subunit
MGYASAIAVFLFAMMLFTNFVVTRLIRRVGQ